MGFPGLLNTLGRPLDTSQSITGFSKKLKNRLLACQDVPRTMLEKNTKTYQEQVGKDIPRRTNTYQEQVGKNVPRRTKKELEETYQETSWKRRTKT